MTFEIQLTVDSKTC